MSDADDTDTNCKHKQFNTNPIFTGLGTGTQSALASPTSVFGVF